MMGADSEYYYSFDDDTPGDIVEALNEDKSIILYDLNSDGSGVMIKIDYLGLHIKQVRKNGNGIEEAN
jgi:hypothetical protein